VGELFIGLMSGTSMDAADAALLEIDPDEPPTLRAHHRRTMPSDLVAALRALAGPGGQSSLEDLGGLDCRLGHVFAETAVGLLDEAGIGADQVRAIGSHGQTILHWPESPGGFSLQIGDPNIIAERSGIDTVADFRRRDMAAGGEGAPLVPAFHAACFARSDETRVVLNIGGIANATVLPTAGPVLGFDTGPGNTLMDAWAREHLGQPMDHGGQWASDGHVHGALLRRLLSDPYFERPPPKSTGPEHFNRRWLQGQMAGDHRPEDVQATLCELTAVTAARAVTQIAPDATRVLVCGGGAHNSWLMTRIRHHLHGCIVEPTAAYGLAPEWVEAAAFAWLAHQTVARQAGNLPSVTGARHPVVLGGLYAGGGRDTEHTP